MASELHRFHKLKKQVAALQRKTDKAQGALDTVMERLRREFGCSTLEDAEKLLRKLREQERKASSTFKAKRRRFEKKWSKVLR